MNLNGSSKQTKLRTQQEIGPFRSELQSSVGSAELKTTRLAGVGPDGVKVSEFGLEQYLNACTPTCHG